MFKRYELIKINNSWHLYFFDNEFKEYVFIRPYKKDTKISSVYNDIKKIYKNNCNIILKYNINK